MVSWYRGEDGSVVFLLQTCRPARLGTQTPATCRWKMAPRMGGFLISVTRVTVRSSYLVKSSQKLKFVRFSKIHLFHLVWSICDLCPVPQLGFVFVIGIKFGLLGYWWTNPRLIFYKKPISGASRTLDPEDLLRTC